MTSCIEWWYTIHWDVLEILLSLGTQPQKDFPSFPNKVKIFRIYLFAEDINYAKVTSPNQMTSMSMLTMYVQIWVFSGYF